jgi:hypothetical protein
MVASVTNAGRCDLQIVRDSSCFGLLSLGLGIGKVLCVNRGTSRPDHVRRAFGLMISKAAYIAQKPRALRESVHETGTRAIMKTARVLVPRTSALVGARSALPVRVRKSWSRPATPPPRRDGRWRYSCDPERNPSTTCHTKSIWPRSMALTLPAARLAGAMLNREAQV